jgi:threonyl-tRNA synthetase
MQVSLPDGKRLELSGHATARDVAAAVGPGLARAALGAKVNGQLTDLFSELPEDAEVSILTARDPEAMRLARHTLAHVMAQAVIDYFEDQGFERSDVKMGVGPVIENGFYYDFDVPRTLTPEDLARIEARMREIIKAKLPLRKYALPRAEALARYEEIGDPYKVELIEDLPADVPLTFYEQGGEEGFTDLCRGPHVPTTGAIPPYFKLMSVAGAYWRGDEKRPMLQRVYGVAFGTKEELEHYLWQLEEAKKRDHRKLGKELDLFTFSEDIGSGIPLFLPRGEAIRHEMERYVREVQTRYGYEHVWTGHVVKEELYRKSGHLQNYLESMFPPMDDEGTSYRLKPMNCPSHMTLFNSRLHSYRELPIRYAEFATLYRFEKSGELSGLTRVRALTQDDCHIFCTEEQIGGEFALALGLIREILETYDFRDYAVRLSLRGAAGKYAGDDDKWARATQALREALDAAGVPYFEAEGEAAFYGPKADFMARDVLSREWQLSTIQVDFIQPERLGCEYIGEDGERHTPVVLHRAVTGTTERFMGVLIEHFAGDFPLWLAPEQVRLVPIADRHEAYAGKVLASLQDASLRATVDSRGERMNAKIRDAELYKVPYIVIVGDKEQEAGQVSFRSRREPDQNGVPLDIFARHLQQQVKMRRLEPTPLTPNPTV